ncbi:hypothetical protein JXK06_03635 [Patescibacteria group bacterium]|nr:hypothetical protein [Patescibacteria group bacterium]
MKMFTETLVGRFSMRDLASFKVEVTKNILIFAVLAAIGSLISIINNLIDGSILGALISVLILVAAITFIAKTKKQKYFVRIVTYENDDLGAEM